jgi:1-acyl-sn-glycerol-3-phosphate acyltransferase
MRKAKTIDEWSLGYWMLKYLWAKNTFVLYYKKIELRNAKIIPRNKPVIIAPNHQNALMDALAIVFEVPFQTIFMTRADIFAKPLARKILTFLNMLPIYRKRDGIASLAKNEEIFIETTRILKDHHNPVCLFPEGNHGDRRRLRPLVKGIFRIAFKAQEDHKDKPFVQIIPTGIDYGHYQKFRQTLFLNFGQPIEVSDYWKQYEENPAVGINALRDRLIEEMRKCMIDIQTEEYYDTYMGLRDFYRPEMSARLGVKKNNLATRFDTDKILIAALDRTLQNNPEKIKTIDQKFKSYAALRDKLNLRDWVFRKEKFSVAANLFLLVFCLALSPLFLLGLFNNWPHYFIPVKLIKKIKDTQFKSTAAWGSGAAIQAVYYLLLAVLAIFFIPFWWAVILYVVSLPFSGIVALWIRKLFIKSMARLRYTFKRKSSADIREVVKFRMEILELLKNTEL